MSKKRQANFSNMIWEELKFCTFWKKNGRFFFSVSWLKKEQTTFIIGIKAPKGFLGMILLLIKFSKHHKNSIQNSFSPFYNA